MDIEATLCVLDEYAEAAPGVGSAYDESPPEYDVRVFRGRVTIPLRDWLRDRMGDFELGEKSLYATFDGNGNLYLDFTAFGDTV